MVLRRRKVFRTHGRQGRSGLISSVALAMLFVAGFAYGLHQIDLRYAGKSFENLNAPAEVPTEGLVPSALEALSAVFRDYVAIPTASAAVDYSKYYGAPERRTYDVQAAPGQVVEVIVRIKNTGSVAWTGNGPRFVSAYTIQPRYHASAFRSSDWISSSQTPRIANATVTTGETAELRFKITAPVKEGTYSDTFQLASENTSWIWGAFFTVRVKASGAVVSAVAAPAAQPVPPVPGPEGAGSAVLLIRSAQRLTAPGGAAASFTAGFKNAGISSWSERSLLLKSGPSIVHDSWSAPDTAVRIAEPVAPGSLALTTFTLTMPASRGDYTAVFALTADGKEVPGVLLEIPLTVTSDVLAAPAPSVSAPVIVSPATPSIPTLNGIEPMIRVGLYYSEVAREEFVADVPYEVRNASGGLLASLQAGSPVQAWHDLATGQYHLTNGLIDIVSPDYLRFVPLDANGLMTALSHVDRPSWNLSLNDNRFRGTLELRRHSSGRLWVINELPMEQYLWGLAESTNSAPAEFQKTLAVAARSYGNWHLEHPGKYDHFTVGALNDQVYKGYGAELRYPTFKVGAQATRGQVVTYANERVITPYFTWSDGRTRAWTEVWGGAIKPWLVSVAAVHDAAAGRSLYGHGVGISVWDAIARANAGETYDAVLRYYYQGTGLQSLY